MNTLIVPHDELSTQQIQGLRTMFDAEYADDYGPWDIQQPYGYAGHEYHAILVDHDTIVGHVGWEYRDIYVDKRRLHIAGIGGVLISRTMRGRGAGQYLMAHLHQELKNHAIADYGYLGCRHEVVPFYLSCGWREITAEEHYISRNGQAVVQEAGSAPILILPLKNTYEEWPEGVIHLCGRSW